MGAHNIGKSEPSQLGMLSTKIIIHEDWDTYKLKNDIALIKLPRPVIFNCKYMNMFHYILIEPNNKLILDSVLLTHFTNLYKKDHSRISFCFIPQLTFLRPDYHQ